MASRISRKVCTLGRPGALGTGRWGSMQDHSSSERSVGYVFLMRARVANHYPTPPFRTVSPGDSVNRGSGSFGAPARNRPPIARGCWSVPHAYRHIIPADGSPALRGPWAIGGRSAGFPCPPRAAGFPRTLGLGTPVNRDNPPWRSLVHSPSCKKELWTATPISDMLYLLLSSRR